MCQTEHSIELNWALCEKKTEIAATPIAPRQMSCLNRLRAETCVLALFCLFCFTPTTYAAYGETDLQYFQPQLSGVSRTHYSGEWYIPYPVNCYPNELAIWFCEYWEYSRVGVTAFLNSPAGSAGYSNSTGLVGAEVQFWLYPALQGIWYQQAWHYVVWDRYEILCQNPNILYSCQMGWYGYIGEGETYDDFTSDSEYVELEPPGPPSCPSPYPELYSAFSTRSAAIQALYNMASVGSTFSFGMVAQLQNASPTEASEFALGAAEWTKSTTSCGSYNSVASIQTTAQNDQNVDVLYLLALTTPDTPSTCGANLWVGDAGAVRDQIRIRKTGISSGCDNHRPETVYHELGHLLGFVHIPLPAGMTIQDADLFHNPRPSGAGPRPIEGHHVRTLVEKY